MNPINPLTGAAFVDKKGGMTVDESWTLWRELWSRQSPDPLGDFKDQPEGFRVAWFDFLANITYRLRATACDYRVGKLQQQITERDSEISRLRENIRILNAEIEGLEQDAELDEAPEPTPVKNRAKNRVTPKAKKKKKGKK